MELRRAEIWKVLAMTHWTVRLVKMTSPTGVYVFVLKEINHGGVFRWGTDSLTIVSRSGAPVGLVVSQLKTRITAFFGLVLFNFLFGFRSDYYFCKEVLI